MVVAEVFLRGTEYNITYGKDYCAMVRAHTMVHATVFTIHWEAFARWLIEEEHDLGYMSMPATNIQLLLRALS